MSEPKHDELDWLAFCYLADELTSGEAEQFESQLATDPDAATALADNVALWAAVSAALRTPEAVEVEIAGSANGVHHLAIPAASTEATLSGSDAVVHLPVERRAGWKVAATWTGVGIAATLAGILTLQMVWPWIRTAEPTVAQAPHTQIGDVADTAQLASAWLATRGELEADSENDPLALIIDSSDDELLADAGSDEFETPDWLLRAVAHAERHSEPMAEPGHP